MPELAPPEPLIQFSGHSSHLVSLAQLCREAEQFTDVVIQCLDGNVTAHRIVLASCSSFLHQAFLTLPQGLPEFTLVLPNVKQEVVKTLIDFLYTGQMTFIRSATHEIQHLVSLLQIDPENVRVEVKGSNMASPIKLKPRSQQHLDSSSSSSGSNKLVQSKITTMISSKSSTPPAAEATDSSSSVHFSPNENQPYSKGACGRSRSSSAQGGNVLQSSLDSTPGPKSLALQSSSGDRTLKQVSLKNLKRKISNEANAFFVGSPSPNVKEIKLKSGLSSHRGGGRGVVRRRSVKPRGRSSSHHSPSGFHDMARVETWEEEPPKTEWIGCDCNRWYHQYCTKLQTVGDDFCCAHVNLTCLKAIGAD